MNNSVLAKLAVLISANTAEFNKGLASARNDFSKFTGTLTKMGATIGAVFGTKELLEFGFATGKLAGEAEGVRNAFERLPQSTKLMKDLKEATGGTVSELDLMKRAVQASNFDIELAALPKLLQFATVRAQQTGQSVDYLVDSIVTGIGRKSKLILDNLGISAVALGEKLKGVSTDAASVGDVARAVGEIAAESLEKAGSLADNTSTKVQQLDASWQNLKVTLGDLVNNVGLPKWVDAITKIIEQANQGLKTGYSVEGLQAYMDMFNRMQPKGKAFLDMMKNIETMAKALKVPLVELSDSQGVVKMFIDPRSKPVLIDETNKATEKLVENLEYLQQKQKELDEQFEQIDKNDKVALKNIGDKIIALQKEIDVLEKLRKAQKTKDPLSGKYQFLPDLEAEGSTNPNLRNEQAASSAKEFADMLKEVGQSAEFAGGALIKLEENQASLTNSMQQTIDFTSVVASSLSGIGQALGNAINGSRNFGASLLSVLGGVLVQLGELLIAAGLGVETFKKSLQSLNGVAAIAAGIALVAIGSAVANSIQSLGTNPKGSRSAAFGSGAGYSGGLNGRGLEILMSGEFRVRGNDLVYIFNRESQTNTRTRY